MQNRFRLETVFALEKTTSEGRGLWKGKPMKKTSDLSKWINMKNNRFFRLIHYKWQIIFPIFANFIKKC